ncbi:DUF2550 domain-containing protein [Sinomonas atrocyanea]|jgi:hypothetical protein|uniref:DUF2550 domain-containing protein n=1 Tax=Sinomonas atrocyanea TaxID=37927 RepID=UPI00277E14B7|nr:DUF2550 domain-containing protein [Sinomonas atrocyanea]MDQ0258298.1 hypothetical protein [Sinomonas atrocyanea]MDR6620565.1 hypothetical protein [Sinomonas atrocyanea]
MDDSAIPFIVLAVVFVLLAALLCALGVRRVVLRRTLGTVDASISMASGPWRMGVCRYQDTELEWFNLLSLSPRARHRFTRSSLELLGRRSPTEAERTRVQADVVIVELQYRGASVRFAMDFNAYAGLASWLEAGPVIGIGTWR